MFNIFKKQKGVEGKIAYYSLQNWWSSVFTEEERNHIEDVFRPMGDSPDRKSLTEGKITSSSQSAAGLLNALAGWFDNPRDRNIAKKIIDKATELAHKGDSVIDLHFALHVRTEIYYKEREITPGALEEAMKACREQISIAPLAAQAFQKAYPWQSLPAHGGYTQLSIILKKQGDYKKIIELCGQAKKQGWAGDWDRRIEEAKKKLAMLANTPKA